MTPEIRVVVLTSHDTEHETIAALSSGADAYGIRDIEVEQLLTAISTAQEGAIYLDPQIVRRVLDKLQPPLPIHKTQPLSTKE
jgi:NarL family two-component system response regulator LiaR